MKKIAIMQPYLFPYIGYWQLINAVDEFVLFDDVNFIMRGYINRNILLNGQAHLFTIPLDKPSQNKLINEVSLKFDEYEKNKFLKMLQCAYKKAPYFEFVYPLLEKVANYDEINLSKYIKYSIINVLSYLGIKRFIRCSSDIQKDNSLKAQDKIIDICKKENANIYINAIGGQALYSNDDFMNNNLVLKFIKMDEISYKQFKNNFVPNLSIIDVLMFNSVEDVNNMLNKYALITNMESV